MKKTNSISKKAIITVLALTLGSSAQASVVNTPLKDPLFSLKEINSQSILIAHGKDGNCGEGKCGGDDKAKETTTKEKSNEGKCGSTKDKIAKKAKKEAKLKEKSAVGKCGSSKSPEAKCGEGTCGADQKAN